MSADILFSRHDRVGLITLNRPEKLNAFVDGMRSEIAAILHQADEDQTLGALVVTGAGRAFSAGGDVARMHELVVREDWAALEALLQAGADVVQTLDDLRVPVLAAVNGVAAGAGANLALACDIRVAGTSATIGESFVRLGLQPDWGGTYFLPRLVGLGRALELTLTGDMLTADHALQIGLFNHVVEDGRVLDETMSMAARIASRPPVAVALARRALRQTQGSSLSDALEVERRNQLQLLKSTEARDAMRSFLASRTAAEGERT